MRVRQLKLYALTLVNYGVVLAFLLMAIRPNLSFGGNPFYYVPLLLLVVVAFAIRFSFAQKALCIAYNSYFLLDYQLVFKRANQISVVHTGFFKMKQDTISFTDIDQLSYSYSATHLLLQDDSHFVCLRLKPEEQKALISTMGVTKQDALTV
jgi:hypothetical protein